jgi:hypothetical protein
MLRQKRIQRLGAGDDPVEHQHLQVEIGQAPVQIQPDFRDVDCGHGGDNGGRRQVDGAAFRQLRAERIVAYRKGVRKGVRALFLVTLFQD